MKKCTLLFIALSLILEVNAQTELNAIRYSNLNPIGTARYSAMGGAFGALGGDLTAISINPAGLGVYRSGTFTITPAYTFSNYNTEYYGNALETSKNDMHLSNIGFATSVKPYNNSVVKAINYSFTYNQTANYDQQYRIESSKDNYNQTTSKLDLGLNEVLEAVDANNGSTDADVWYNDLSYQTQMYLDAQLIYMVDGEYTNDYKISSYGAIQEKSIKTEGYAGQYDFSMSANILDRLYIGASIGIAHVSYKEWLTYYEQPYLSDNNALYNFTQEEYFKERGNGINFKLGAIARINDWIRLGAAIHTPTYYSMHNTTDASVYSTYELDGVQNDEGVQNLYYDWNLNTPLRAMGSAAFLYKNIGLISFDYEFVNYPGMHMQASDYSFDYENDQIDYQFKAAHNFRVGAEYNIGPLSLRGGVAYLSTPYKSFMDNSCANTLVYSGGIGFKSKNMFFDITGKYSACNEYDYVYGEYTSYEAIAKKDWTQFTLLSTIGFKF